MQSPDVKIFVRDTPKCRTLLKTLKSNRRLLQGSGLRVVCVSDTQVKALSKKGIKGYPVLVSGRSTIVGTERIIDMLFRPEPAPKGSQMFGVTGGGHDDFDIVHEYWAKECDPSLIAKGKSGKTYYMGEQENEKENDEDLQNKIRDFNRRRPKHYGAAAAPDDEIESDRAPRPRARVDDETEYVEEDDTYPEMFEAFYKNNRD